MIELLFSDSAAGALVCAKKLGNGTFIGGISIKITTDRDGNEITESYEPKPYTGPTVDGSPSDIASVWLMADIGDISGDLVDSRLKLWREISGIHGWEDDSLTEQATKLARNSIIRLKEAAKTGEPVRIWHSDASAEACGFYWAMDILKSSAGLITHVKIPHFYPTKDGYIHFQGTAELSPEHFSALLSLERSLEPAERQAMAFEWRNLVRENAPLRAMVNGRLCSAPIYFYDYVLQQVIPDGECTAAFIIGCALSDGPNGVADWWYAQRLKEMIASGKLEVVKENKTFYTSIIRRNSK